MQIYFQKARISVRYRLNVVNDQNIKKVSTIQLRPSCGGRFLQIYVKKHFR